MDLRACAVAAVKLSSAATEPMTPRQDKTGPTRRISNIAGRVDGARIEVDYGMSRAACSEYDLRVFGR